MKATTGGRIVCGRDAVTGRFIPVAKAKKRRTTSVVQTLKVKRTKRGRFARRAA